MGFCMYLLMRIVGWGRQRWASHPRGAVLFGTRVPLRRLLRLLVLLAFLDLRIFLTLVTSGMFGCGLLSRLPTPHYWVKFPRELALFHRLVVYQSSSVLWFCAVCRVGWSASHNSPQLAPVLVSDPGNGVNICCRVHTPRAVGWYPNCWGVLRLVVMSEVGSVWWVRHPIRAASHSTCHLTKTRVSLYTVLYRKFRLALLAP